MDTKQYWVWQKLIIFFEVGGKRANLGYSKQNSLRIFSPLRSVELPAIVGWCIFRLWPGMKQLQTLQRPWRCPNLAGWVSQIKSRKTNFNNQPGLFLKQPEGFPVQQKLLFWGFNGPYRSWHVMFCASWHIKCLMTDSCHCWVPSCWVA